MVHAIIFMNVCELTLPRPPDHECSLLVCRNKVKVTLQQLNDGDKHRTTSPKSPSSHSPTPPAASSSQQQQQQQHDRYINYEIAQSLVKGQATKRDKSSRSATPGARVCGESIQYLQFIADISIIGSL